ncbi:ParA family protein [uncultured Muribaculum sp.]
MIIALANQKSGVAKTTSVFNIGIELANRGNKVLMVDFDAQASLKK